MRFKSLALLAATIGIATSQAASAADIPARMPTKAPAAVPVIFSWSGWYAGLHAGYTWGRTSYVDVLGYNTIPGDNIRYNNDGFVGGGQLGFNWQSGMFVLGAEADVGYLGAEGSARAPASVLFFNGDTVASTKSDLYFTIRGRLGLAMNQWLLYATGGGIGINTRTSVVDTCFAPPCGGAIINATNERIRFGWTVGGGIEYALSSPWSVKGEYLYYDIGNQTVSAPNFFPPSTVPAFTWPFTTKQTGHIARLGINYRFGGMMP